MQAPAPTVPLHLFHQINGPLTQQTLGIITDARDDVCDGADRIDEGRRFAHQCRRRAKITALTSLNNTFVQEWHGREQALRENLDRVLPGYVEARQRRDFRTAPALMGESTAFIDAIRPVADIVTG